MLVLARRVGEKIVIGDDITIEVVRLGPAVVRLGITAPGLSIHREEIYEEIQMAKQEANANGNSAP